MTAMVLAGCYTNAPANRDVRAAWRGRPSTEIVDRWGPTATRGGDVLVWSYDTVHVDLPSIAAVVHQTPTTLDARVAIQAGEIWKTTTEAAALVDPVGTITRVDGAALHWGPPNDANLHWGTIFGAAAGMGRLDSTSTPLPSGSAYVGGMLSPVLGLVGTFALAAGSSPDGGAMGLAWGLAPQWWPINRLSVRAGPAMVLTFDPGFTNATLQPGATAGASYAFVKVGVLAVDLRLEVVAGTHSSFGMLGVGVNGTSRPRTSGLGRLGPRPEPEGLPSSSPGLAGRGLKPEVRGPTRSPLRRTA